MKNIIKLSTLILVFVLIGCNAIDDKAFKPNTESGWVEFENESLQVLSDAGSVEIPIEYNVPVNRLDTSISYEVQVVEGSAPSVETGTFTTIVPADTRDASITFDIDPSITSNYTVQFTLISTSNPDVIVGLDGDNPIVFALEVCYGVLPLEWTGSSFIDGSQVNTFDMTLTPTGNEGEYEVSSAWGTNFVAEATGNPAFDGQFIYDGVMTLNPDNTLSIVGNGDPATFPGTVPAGEATNGNLFDPCNNQMFYTLDQGVFQGDFVVDVVLSPAP